MRLSAPTGPRKQVPLNPFLCRAALFVRSEEKAAKRLMKEEAAAAAAAAKQVCPCFPRLLAPQLPMERLPLWRQAAEEKAVADAARAVAEAEAAAEAERSRLAAGPCIHKPDPPECAACQHICAVRTEEEAAAEKARIEAEEKALYEEGLRKEAEEEAAKKAAEKAEKDARKARLAARAAMFQ